MLEALRTCGPSRLYVRVWGEGMTSLHDNDFAAWVATHHERISEVLADRYSSVKVITVDGKHRVATFTRRGGWFDLDVPPWMDGWNIVRSLKTFIKAHRRLTA